jgi:hypothetical protein
VAVDAPALRPLTDAEWGRWWSALNPPPLTPPNEHQAERDRLAALGITQRQVVVSATGEQPRSVFDLSPDECAMLGGEVYVDSRPVPLSRDAAFVVWAENLPVLARFNAAFRLAAQIKARILRTRVGAVRVVPAYVRIAYLDTRRRRSLLKALLGAVADVRRDAASLASVYERMLGAQAPPLSGYAFPGERYIAGPRVTRGPNTRPSTGPDMGSAGRRMTCAYRGAI